MFLFLTGRDAGARSVCF